MSNLLNFTNIYPPLPCFYVIGVDVKCIAMQYIKWSDKYESTICDSWSTSWI